MAAALHGFDAVIDHRIETLILGSFPSAASLAAAQYYAHPRNQFWRILGELLETPLHEMAYVDRLPILLERRIGLWDAMGACDRRGSLDADIRNPRVNDFSHLRSAAPRLLRIAFNGATAGRQASGLEAAGYQVSVLPSTSPAHASLSYADKLRTWRDWWTSASALPAKIAC